MSEKTTMSKEQTDDNNKIMSQTIADIEKKFGKGTLMCLGDGCTGLEPVESFTTGTMSLDIALGIGGLPRGRIVEVYGPESCLAGDTFLSYEVWNGDIRQNHKGGSIKRLYERFHRIDVEGSGFYTRDSSKNSDYYVKSINEHGRVIINRVHDVVKTGFKQCLLLTTRSGFELVATKDHKFFIGNDYVPLSEISVGTNVFIHNNTRFTKEHKPIQYREVMVKFHPTWGKKWIENYLYYRGRVCNAVYEASMNNLSYDEYIKILNTSTENKIRSLKFIPDGFDIHHLNADFTDDSLSNLLMIEKSEHYKLHAIKNHNNLRFMVVPDEVISIEDYGEVETYDLKCMYPYNNYIANGIVVHNSGKTTMCLQLVSEVQKLGGSAAYVDAEHALDVNYAKNIGVDINTLLISQPDNGEQALEVVDMLVRSGAVALVVVDSVAALTPKAEIEGEMGDSHMGLQARLMSQALRKLAASVSNTGCTVVFVNQIRQKIGVTWGSNETTTGGNALKFYSSVRLDIRRIAAIKQGDNVIGNRTRIKVAKNKVAAPFRECEFDIIFGRGICKIGDLLDLAVEKNIVEKSGSWFSYKSERLGQGRDSVRDMLISNTKLADSISEEVRKAYGIGTGKIEDRPKPPKTKKSAN